MKQNLSFFTKLRHLSLGLMVMSVFCLISWRLTSFAKTQEIAVHLAPMQLKTVFVKRPQIFDRRGALLATDIDVPTIYAEPAYIMHPAQVAHRLGQFFPKLDKLNLLQTLSHKKRKFAYIARGVRPFMAQKIHDAGLPGIGLTYEKRRVYPKGASGGHILGYVNIDNAGQSGMERTIDQKMALGERGLAEDVVLALDLAATHLLDTHLARAVKQYKAKAGSALVMDVHTGEIIAAASNPVMDPQRPAKALKAGVIDRNSKGLYELGSVFKVVTMAMALDLGLANLDTRFDVETPIQIGERQLEDPHPLKGEKSLTYIFLRSSNVGTARIAALAGPRRHKRFLEKLGFTSALKTDIGATPNPILPRHWTQNNMAIMSFGHGIAVTPLQFTAAVSSLVNGGRYIPPTFLKRSRKDAYALGVEVVRPQTSKDIVSLMRLNVETDRGTGRRARSAHYAIGGKTGTAEKIIDGVYQKDAVLSSFVSVFPANKPQYVLFVALDEPQAIKETKGKRSASMNAAPVSGAIIDELAPLLAIPPTYKKKSTASINHLANTVQINN